MKRGQRLTDMQLAMLDALVEQGRMTVHSVRPNKPGEGLMNLHTAWALEARGLVRLRDSYIETVAWPTPLAKQLCG